MPERSFLMSNYYFNLLSQAQKLYRHNRQGSYKTRERYFEAYKRFLKFVDCEYNLQKLANISGKHLSGYISYMQNIGYSAATIKTDLAAIRFWHDKIPAAKYVLPGNCEFCLERRKFSGTDRTWSAGELNRMIAECWKADREDYVTMLTLARYAGLRLHEALRIDTATAKKAIRDGIITVKGKGGKTREIPINKSISIELEKILKVTPPGQKLFVPPDKPTHIVKTEFQQFILKNRRNAADENRMSPLTFHGLRHTYAAEMYKLLVESGKDEHTAKLEVSRLLGHERENVTNIYLASVKRAEE